MGLTFHLGRLHRLILSDKIDPRTRDEIDVISRY